MNELNPKIASQFLPYGKQSIDEEDIEAITKAITDPYLTCGPAVTHFENAFSEKVGAAKTVAVSNGTVALHLAATAFDIGPHDQVLVPSITFLSTANAVRFLGGDVVFTDVDPETGLMDWHSYQAALTRADKDKLKAVFYVHMNGQVGADFIRIAEDAKSRGLSVLEDAAHAAGSFYKDNTGQHFSVGACAHSDAATFSFHPVKTMTTGEGGAICIKDLKLGERVNRLRHHGMIMGKSDEEPWAYDMVELGYNARITDLQCALGLSQLSKLDDFVAKRRALVNAYDAEFKNEAYIKPITKHFPEITGWHLYPLLIDFQALKMTKGDLIKALKESNIGTQVHYIPVHTQPYYKNLYGDLLLPGAAAYYKAILSLPLYPDLTFEELDYIVGNIKDICGGR